MEMNCKDTDFMVNWQMYMWGQAYQKHHIYKKDTQITHIFYEEYAHLTIQ